jgi:hypothetical protein
MDLASEWGLSMTALALLAVLVIFGTALWFILSAMKINKKFRWFQIVRRRDRKERAESAAKWSGK